MSTAIHGVTCLYQVDIPLSENSRENWKGFFSKATRGMDGVDGWYASLYNPGEKTPYCLAISFKFKLVRHGFANSVKVEKDVKQIAETQSFCLHKKQL